MLSRLHPQLRVVASALAERGIRSLAIGRSAWAALEDEAPVEDARILCAAEAPELHALPDVVCQGVSGPVRWTFRDASIELLPAPEADLLLGLQAAPWSVLAFGLDPTDGQWLDPCGGTEDFAARRLEPAGSATRRAPDPVAAIAAARLAAELRLSATDAARSLLRRAAASFPPRGGAPLRHQLTALLLAPAPTAGLRVLRETGLEEAMIPGTRPHAHALVEAAPAEAVPRFAAWLLDTHAPRFLGRLRMPRAQVRQLEGRIAYRAPERAIAAREASVERAVARLGSRAAVQQVIDQRRLEWQLEGSSDEEGETRLRQIETLLSGPSAPALAWSGHDVMQATGLAAGRDVGRALAFLRRKVAAEPAGNRPDQLARWLEEWLSDPASAGPDSPPSGRR